MSKLTDEEWLQRATDSLADDVQRAEVIKAKIAADSAVEQARIKETAATERARVTDSRFVENQATVRALALAALVIACLCGTCVAYNRSADRKDVDIARIHAEYPAAASVTPHPAKSSP